MTRVEVATTLEASADDVWELIGAFNALSEWHPGVKQSTLDDGGRIRVLELANGSTLIERLQSFSQSERSYSYSIEKGPLPVGGYRSELRVLERTDTSCRVEWSGEFTPAGATEADAVAIVRGIYRAGLDHLVKRFGA
jgi:hypothetical protein